MNQTLTMINGVKVGHSALSQNLTGCTVILFDRPAITAVDARGGWPGTFDTDSIAATKTFYRKNAIFLTGGDVFGLTCASGIQQFLLARRMASNSIPGKLPGVVGANIYDLDFGRSIAKVDFATLGYKACLNASSGPVKEGNYGAGIGATVGKLRGIKFAMKGGVGSSATKISSIDIAIGAIVITNSLGNVFESDGRIIAGTRADNGNKRRQKVNRIQFVGIEDIINTYYFHRAKSNFGRSKATTIGAVVTDLALTHEEALKVAEMAHDGLARCIKPSHATTDGDTIFCATTAKRQIRVTHDLLDVVGHYGAEQITKSVLSAVKHAKPLNNLPAYRVGIDNE
jgi:L-aminopeptidase/D-esterase-like protein